MNKLLSSNDIINLIGYPINVITYNELTEYKNINDILINDICLILYPSIISENIGHWTILTKSKKKITFFDPYGTKPDYQKESPITDFYLTKLLINLPNNIHYNECKLQKLSKNINTCGRWCALWGVNKDKMDVETFCYLIKNISKKWGIDTDSLAVFLT
jgi:hypothetical protein